MDGGVVDLHATLGHHLLEISQTQRVSGVPTHANQHHLQREVQPLDHAAQRRVRQLGVQGNHWPILANPPYCDRTYLASLCSPGALLLTLALGCFIARVAIGSAYVTDHFPLPNLPDDTQMFIT